MKAQKRIKKRGDKWRRKQKKEREKVQWCMQRKNGRGLNRGKAQKAGENARERKRGKVQGDGEKENGCIYVRYFLHSYQRDSA